MDMYTVYRNEKEQEVYPIDVDAWLKDGWSLEPDEQVLADKAESGEKIDLNDVTLQALKNLGLSVADSQKIIKSEKFESVEDAISLVPALSKYKTSLFVNSPR
jgi:hypothetical protein